MVCNCFDLRSNSSGAKFLSNKFVSIIAGLIQLVLWVSVLIWYIIQSTKVLVSAGAIAFEIICVLICIGFSAFLLVGLFKDKLSYIEIYLAFVVVQIVLLTFVTTFLLFTSASQFGIIYFLIIISIILIAVLTYFVLRNYYLSVTFKHQNRNIGRNII